MSALQQQVRRTIRRYGLCPAGSRLLVGLSGGADSVALTLLLLELSATADFTVGAVAHFNHRLRDAAERDEQFCRDLAARLGLPMIAGGADVRAYAAAERLSLEDAARRSRYTFLHRAAADAGAGLIAVGHTRDDQAETFLLKLSRGAGLAGLGGIYPRRGIVVRPLLDASRADLRAWLQARGQGWVEDETNASLDNARSRIRHRVLPELDAAYRGAAAPSIARSAGLVREDGEWLDELAGRRFDQISVQADSSVQLDAGLLAAEPAPIRRRVVLRAIRALAAGREVGLEHVEAVLDVLAGASGGADVPGSRVELRRGKLVLTGGGQGRPVK